MTQPLLQPGFLRTLDRLALNTRRAMAGTLQGERRSPRRGASVEFADYRPYTHGDDFRQIDWKLYGRMERFYLKLFVAEEDLTLHLLMDSSASMDWGEPNKLQYARQLAATLGYLALIGLDRVVVSALAGSKARMPAVRGRRGALSLFDFLQRIPTGGSTSLAEVCRRYAQATPAGGPLLLCSDMMDETWEAALRALKTRPFDVTILHILAPQELRPDLDGDLRLLDIEGGKPVELSIDPDVMQRYNTALNDWQQAIERMCNGLGMLYIPVDTGLPIEEFTLTTLRQRGLIS